MEEVINKPDDQFEVTLIDLINYGKETSEKEALIKELYQNSNIKSASLSSSNYSSAASSSSSSSSSTSSTLSSPSQNNSVASKTSNNQNKYENPTRAHNNELEEIEMAVLEDLGKTATIVEHRSSDSSNHYFNNFVTAQYRTRPTTNNLTSQRRKKRAGTTVLSQEIPGHKGGQELDWLVNFIESGASNQSANNRKTYNSNTTNKRTKSQTKKTTTQHRPIQNKAILSNQVVAQSQLSQRKSQPPNQSAANTNNNIKPSKPRVLRESIVQHQEVDKSNYKQAPKPTVQLSKEEPHKAVTFANHIELIDDNEAAQYTFGFFDEQKPKIMKTSPKSDCRRHYVFNDNIDANSFNYKQILEFISKSWNQTMAVKKNKNVS